jgi:hypothetical protein
LNVSAPSCISLSTACSSGTTIVTFHMSTTCNCLFSGGTALQNCAEEGGPANPCVPGVLLNGGQDIRFTTPTSWRTSAPFGFRLVISCGNPPATTACAAAPAPACSPCGGG